MNLTPNAPTPPRTRDYHQSQTPPYASHATVSFSKAHCCYKFQKFSSIVKLKPAFNPFLFSESMTVKNVGEFQFAKNGMLRHSLGGEVIFFFAAYYGFLLKRNALFVCLSCSLLPACPPADVGGRQWGWQWGQFSCQPEASSAQSYRGNFQFLGIFWGKSTC